MGVGYRIEKEDQNMPRIIQQAAFFPVSPERLFDMYLDPVAHAAFTGGPVIIGDQAGAAFQAFGGMVSGTVLQVVPKRLIVQSWRAAHWKPEDMDSTLILTFWPEGEGARIELVQVNVADHDFAGVSQGWEKYYWSSWLEYLQAG
jgi:uncharacterized protein YndB with AHSA1/START domain